MAALSEKSLSCGICRDPLKDPLLLPCGHSYCRDCVERLFKLPPPQPIYRDDFLRFARDISLDPNTANPYLALSEENTKLTGLKEPLSYSDHPERFDRLLQVLSKEELAGRCYWELESSELGRIGVAVSYKDIDRKDRHKSWFGFNDKSWLLECREPSEYGFVFNSVISEFFGPVSQRFGVYLDQPAGSLSFYCVQDQTMTLLHRVQAAFTKPLFAGVGLPSYGTAHFPKLR